MSAPSIRDATLYDAAQLAPRLRAQDVREIAESSGMTPLSSLLAAVRSSQWSCAVDDGGGTPLALFGVTPMEGLVGIPWLLVGEGAIEKVPRMWMARQARKQLQRMHSQFPHLVNVVAAWNTEAIQWLDWLDFKFTACHPVYGKAGVPFLQFERIDDV